MSKQELLDVVNEQDEVVGVATRKDCHKNPDLMHRTVQFTLVDSTNNKILLTQRSLTKSHDAGLYCFLGEHVFSGESYESCLVRGTEEELGYTPSNYIYAAENIFKYQLQTERVKFYLAVWDGKSLTWDNKELESVHWVSLTDLKSDKYNKSEMTQFWIDHVDWSSAIGVDL